MRGGHHAGFGPGPGPVFLRVLCLMGRGRENRFTSSPAICSQSAALPPFPQRRT